MRASVSRLQPEPGQAAARQPDGALAALCDSAVRLLSAAEHPPARLKLTAGGASVELEWPQPGPVAAAGPAGPAAAEANGSATARPAGTTAAAAVAAGPAASAAAAPAAPAAPGAQGADVCIRAPMIGTFYHAPEPGSAPFVRPGDVVEAGQQVGILEVMKLMTPVEADRRVRVVDFLVPDAAAVEHGQPLISCAAA